jgi:hypothetical protein
MKSQLLFIWTVLLISFLGVKTYAQCAHSCQYHEPVEINNSRSGAESGSMSQSESGHLKIIDSNGNVTKKYYYLYCYLYAYTYNEEVKNKNQNFNLSGYLGDGGDLQFVGKVYGKPYLLYENDNYQLKVPFKSGNGVYFKQKSSASNRVVLPWQCISGD